ncbi:helix-turn-helix transcriptional regulator [Rhizobium ruizarguesonis]
MTFPPRLIGRKEAAEYCGISPTCFSMWVAQGKMPPALPGTRRWDRHAIDAMLNALGGIGEPTSIDERSALKKWRDEKKGYDRPRFGLDAKSENILVAMSYNTDLNTLDVLPGAGPVLMGRLVGKGLAKCQAAEGRQRYIITEEGHAEAVRIFEMWKRR